MVIYSFHCFCFTLTYLVVYSHCLKYISLEVKKGVHYFSEIFRNKNKLHFTRECFWKDYITYYCMLQNIWFFHSKIKLTILNAEKKHNFFSPEKLYLGTTEALISNSWCLYVGSNCNATFSSKRYKPLLLNNSKGCTFSEVFQRLFMFWASILLHTGGFIFR